MPRNVRFARNVVIGFGVFMICGGLFMLCTEPTHWENYAEQFAGAFFVFSVVRHINRGEGEWQNSASLSDMIPRKRKAQKEGVEDEERPRERLER